LRYFRQRAAEARAARSLLCFDVSLAAPALPARLKFSRMTALTISGVSETGMIGGGDLFRDILFLLYKKANMFA
jgi:hypothetical protein